MAPPSLASEALKFMQEVQEQCFLLGIPLRTRHREVAPGQYEVVPLFGTATTQIDQNLMVMQIIQETAVKHNLAAILHEKPFQGLNGSGKHNNWSMSTTGGVSINLLNAPEIVATTGRSDIFPVIMAAMVKAVNLHGMIIHINSSYSLPCSGVTHLGHLLQVIC